LGQSHSRRDANPAGRAIRRPQGPRAERGAQQVFPRRSAEARQAVSMDSEPLPETGQPVGPKVDMTPAGRPGPVTLQGRFGRVERLDAKRHGAALWEAFQGRPELW